MNIGIVGLGLIGGSIGLKLQRLKHTIYGVTNNNLNKKKVEFSSNKNKDINKGDIQLFEGKISELMR